MFEDLDDRRRMIAETSAFIEWGLAHPEAVRRIPRKRVGEGGFSRRVQVVFWSGVFGTVEAASRTWVGRLLRRVLPG